MSRRGDNIRKRADGRWEGRYRMVLENGEKRYQCHLDKDDAKNSVCRNMYPVLFLYNFINHLTG